MVHISTALLKCDLRTYIVPGDIYMLGTGHRNSHTTGGVCGCLSVCQVGTVPDYRDQAEPREALTAAIGPCTPTPASVPVESVLTQALTA